MSAPWWTQDSAPAALAPDGVQPQLLPPQRKAVSARLKQRIPAYTPEWTRRDAHDPGMALVQLFGEQMEPVLQRLNRLPEKALVEYLGIGGVSPLPAAPARALLQFEAAADAPGSVQVPEGFQCSARSQGQLVVFETERTLYVAPGKLAQVALLQDGSLSDGVLPALLPFGDHNRGTLLLGIEADAAPGPRLALHIALDRGDGPPPPASTGGLQAAPATMPVLTWEVLDAGSAQPAAVVLDETRGFTQDGAVELDVPASWRPSLLAAGAEPLRWLRVRMVQGMEGAPPVVAAIRLNCVAATAARTVRDEVLQPVADSEGRQWSLARTPVLPGSLRLEVDEGGFEADPVRVPWKEVASLAGAGPDARVYTLDARSGVVSFGDGQRGQAVPRGFRHVHAARYRVGGGTAGAVPAKAISTMMNAIARLASVSNPLPAGGGTGEESQADAVARGPQELRTRGRAVTVADYALLAQRAPGASVARAHAVAGLHPDFPGLPQAGVVAVFVVPADGPDHALLPDAATLASVSKYLSEEVAPAGVEVVAAAPRYHRVRVEAGIVVDADASAGETVSLVLEQLDRYLDPRTGGGRGRGWTFGGRIVYVELVQQVAQVRGVHAVQHLNLVVDGTRVPACQDHAISAQGLLAPATHEVVVSAWEAP